MKRILLVLVLLLPPSPALAQFEQGALDYAMGKYDPAYQTMVALATAGNHAYAQYYTGVMNEKGQGTAQNHGEAARWYRAAAEQGVSQAQLHLGQLYLAGRGVPKDVEQAFAWFGVAAKLGNVDAARAQEEALKLLAPAELAGAKTLTEDYAAKYSKPPAALRAPDNGPPGGSAGEDTPFGPGNFMPEGAKVHAPAGGAPSAGAPGSAPPPIAAPTPPQVPTTPAAPTPPAAPITAAPAPMPHP